MKVAAAQFARYAAIGIASNALSYVLYLALTQLGWGPKLTMSLLYGLAVLQTFAFNKRWTFQHRGLHSVVFARYCMAYGFGYATNLAMLALFVDRLGYPHQAVQAVMIILLAVMLFLLQKHWVFQAEDLKTQTNG